jgi:HD-like signal output (HDOD) protein
MQRTLTQVKDLLQKSSVNHNRLSEVISRDPGFSLYVLQQINNLPNPPKAPVTKISLAIPLLGMDAIDQASHTLPSVEERLKGPPRRGLIDCYSRAAHAAIYARSLAESARWQESDSLYTAALLHDISEMALWAWAPDEIRTVHQQISQGTPRESAAEQILGTTLEALSVQLGTHWKLPELIRDSQRISNRDQPKPLCVMLASVVARESSLGWRREKTNDVLEQLAAFLDISHDDAIAYVHRLGAQAARELHELPLPLPAFHLIAGESTSPDSATVDATTATDTHPEKVTTDQEPVAKTPPASQQPDKISPQPPTTKVKKDISHPPAGSQSEQPRQNASRERDNPLQALLNSALQQMHEELGLSRAMFAMLGPDKSTLRARFVVESAKQLSLKGFVLDVKSSNLFKALLSKPQAISLNKGNAEKYLPMIPQSALEQINSSGFVSMSVFIKDKPVGIFYADNGISGPGVTRQQYDNFKVICQKTMQSLTH